MLIGEGHARCVCMTRVQCADLLGTYDSVFTTDNLSDGELSRAQHEKCEKKSLHHLGDRLHRSAEASISFIM